MCEGLSKISSNFTLHLIKTDLANLRFPSFEKGEACQSILIALRGKTHPRRPRSVGPGEKAEEKARQKFSGRGGKPLGTDSHRTISKRAKRMLVPDWAQKMLCIIVSNRRTASPDFFSWVRTRRLLTRSRLVWFTKEMHVVRNLSVCSDERYISKYW